MNSYNIFDQTLKSLGSEKMLITLFNTHSYNLSRKDKEFEKSLRNCDILIPDDFGIKWAKWILEGKRIKKFTGTNVMSYYLNRLQNKGDGKAFFLGYSVDILEKIKQRAAKEFPGVEVYTYSPPLNTEFSSDKTKAIIYAINSIKPDVLFVGLKSPTQEKWVYNHFNKLETGPICCIGKVFESYAGTISSAPNWMIKIGLKGFYDIVKFPWRMIHRYFIDIPLFMWRVVQVKFRESIHIPLYSEKNSRKIKNETTVIDYNQIQTNTKPPKSKIDEEKMKLQNINS